MILKFYKPSAEFFFLKFEATNSDTHYLCLGLQKQLCPTLYQPTNFISQTLKLEFKQQWNQKLCWTFG